jgi:tripartite-type tricarboxylate transporter receptor subunit TctC
MERPMAGLTTGLTTRILAMTVAALLALTAAARAADFYQGKQITIVVGFSAGGTYDATARLFARHLGKHLSGNPTVIVRNMPGAGSITATMHVYTAAPKDGTELGVVGGGTVLEPLLLNPQAKYNPERFNWLGGRTQDTFLCVVWHTVPVKTIDDVKKRETVVGSTGPGSRTLTFPKALNELIGTKFKIVTGYPGGNDISLALERGEVEGYCGWSIDSIRSRAPQWLTDGTIRPLAQFTLSKPELANVPLGRDLVPTETGRQAIDFFTADSLFAWPLMAPPDLPAERVAELRTAFDAMTKDPQFLADAGKQNLEVNPVSGSAMQEFIARLYATPPEVLEVVRKIYAGR